MTKLLYFRDSSLFRCFSTILSVEKHTDSANFKLRLDQTVLYPQGGGQPSDKGWILVHKEGLTNRYNIDKVSFSPTGEVDHFISVPMNDVSILEPNMNVEVVVDENLRDWHNRLHSASHVIDAAIYILDIKSYTAGKGYHFEDSPYVEFIGIETGMGTKQELAKKIEDLSNDLVNRNLPCFIEYENDDIEDYKCRRSMRIGEIISIPCGGTHVNYTGEIGPIKIRKIDIKQGRSRICYSVQKKA